MRVVAVGDGLFEDKKGGGRRYLSEVAARLRGRGHDVRLVVPRLDPSFPSTDIVRGCRVFRHEVGEGHSLAALASRYRSAQRAFEQATSDGCDLVNVHFAQTAFAALRRSSAARIPVVYNFQGPWPGEVWVERAGAAPNRAVGERARDRLSAAARVAAMFLIERAVTRRADRFIVLSSYSRDTLRRLYQIGMERIAVIPSGVDTERFRPHLRPEQLRMDAGIEKDTLVLFTARRLVSRMGIDLLLQALRRVANETRVRLLVAGVGPLRQSLERTATALGVDHLVTWMGAISDEELVRSYQIADLVVVPTVAYEGFGLVTVEGLACGTPVVATPVGASPEVLSGLRPSLLASSPHSGALAQAILMARSNAPTREECRQYVEARYSWDVVFPMVERELVGATRKGSDISAPAWV